MCKYKKKRKRKKTSKNQKIEEKNQKNSQKTKKRIEFPFSHLPPSSPSPSPSSSFPTPIMNNDEQSMWSSSIHKGLQIYATSEF